MRLAFTIASNDVDSLSLTLYLAFLTASELSHTKFYSSYALEQIAVGLVLDDPLRFCTRLSHVQSISATIGSSSLGSVYSIGVAFASVQWSRAFSIASMDNTICMPLWLEDPGPTSADYTTILGVLSRLSRPREPRDMCNFLNCHEPLQRRRFKLVEPPALTVFVHIQDRPGVSICDLCWLHLRRHALGVVSRRRGIPDRDVAFWLPSCFCSHSTPSELDNKTPAWNESYSISQVKTLQAAVRAYVCCGVELPKDLRYRRGCIIPQIDLKTVLAAHPRAVANTDRGCTRGPAELPLYISSSAPRNPSIRRGRGVKVQQQPGSVCVQFAPSFSSAAGSNVRLVRLNGCCFFVGAVLTGFFFVASMVASMALEEIVPTILDYCPAKPGLNSRPIISALHPRNLEKPQTKTKQKDTSPFALPSVCGGTPSYVAVVPSEMERIVVRLWLRWSWTLQRRNLVFVRSLKRLPTKTRLRTEVRILSRRRGRRQSTQYSNVRPRPTLPSLHALKAFPGLVSYILSATASPIPTGSLRRSTSSAIPSLSRASYGNPASHPNSSIPLFLSSIKRELSDRIPRSLRMQHGSSLHSKLVAFSRRRGVGHKNASVLIDEVLEVRRGINADRARSLIVLNIEQLTKESIRAVVIFMDTGCPVCGNELKKVGP
ncbi:hypothetical protein B0H16DRAFT_1450985 [Mycena metata]|uniref:Uncharacterized protein n=1 Tax=Mycena metata TaxID=1033252 RepID=A0AAD7NSC5_9AGAR|nr:hypothetical protein B0H16DRAFT_1450985 [Mycena metata]